MDIKSTKSNTDLIGTFLDTSKSRRESTEQQAPSEAASVDRIMAALQQQDHQTAVMLEFLEQIGGSMKANLDAIQYLEGFGLIQRDKDDQGRPTLKIAGS